LKGCWPLGSSVPFYRISIFGSLAGEDRLMSYESLSDGGCICKFSMLDQVDLLLQQCFSCSLCQISPVTTMKSCGQCSPCREGDRMDGKIIA
jgi:NADH-quinone oxidoreductase subunit F